MMAMAAMMIVTRMEMDDQEQGSLSWQDGPWWDGDDDDHDKDGDGTGADEEHPGCRQEREGGEGAGALSVRYGHTKVIVQSDHSDNF